MQHVLVIQGAGSEGAHKADRPLADSLQAHLGPDYRVWYPPMPNEAEPEFDIWDRAIHAELERIAAPAFLVGHSIGASVLAKVLSSTASIGPNCLGLFLMAAPFWHNDAVWRWQECTLPEDAGLRLPSELPVYLYHGEADRIVPVSHLQMCASILPQASVRRLPGRDHQLNEDLCEVAHDIAETRPNTRGKRLV